MTDPEAPRAVLSLSRDGQSVEVGPIDGTIPCDLELVDGLLRFDLAARRLGWQLRLDEVTPDLRELFDLVGLAGRVTR